MVGAIVHFEIEGRDATRLREFYGELFGWRVDLIPDNPAEYALVQHDKSAPGIGGAISRVPDDPSPTWAGPTRAQGYPGHVTVFVEVDDVEVALGEAERLGATRMQGPDLLRPGVEFGKFTDPDGHLVGVVTAETTATS